MPHPLLSGILLWSAAHAADPPTIAVVGLHQAGLTPQTQERICEAIALEIEDTRVFRARRPDPFASQLTGREEVVLQEAFFGPARDLLEDGKTLYNQAQPAEAAPVLEDAVQTLRLGMGTARGTKELWDAWVYLGASRLSMGRPREARDAFAAAVALAPLRHPDAARFPPDLVERYETVRRELTALASTLDVTADERGTVIFVNGEERGTVPALIEDVVPGDVYVFARSPRGFTAFREVRVPEAGSEQVAFRLGEPALGRASDNTLVRSRQVASLYRALGRQADVDLILLAGTVGDDLLVQLYDARADAFSATIEIPYFDEAGDEVVAVLDDLLEHVREDGTFESDFRATNAVPLDVGSNVTLSRILVLPVTSPRPEIDDVARAGPPKWLTYAAIGAGGALVVTGAAIGISAATTDPFQGTISVGPLP